MAKATYLKQLNTVQVQGFLEKHSPLFIPVGTLEPHGRHLPVGTDTYCAEKVAEKLCEAFDGVIAPSVEYGLTNVFAQTSPSSFFPIDLYQAFVEQIVRTFYRQGFSRIVIINGHGGNKDALKPLLRKIAREFPIALSIINWWMFAEEFVGSVYGTQPGGHAAVEETAAILYSHPELVVKENYEPEKDDCIPNEALWFYPPVGEVLLSEPNQGQPCFDKEKADIFMERVIGSLRDRLERWFNSFGRLEGGLRPR